MRWLAAETAEDSDAEDVSASKVGSEEARPRRRDCRSGGESASPCLRAVEQGCCEGSESWDAERVAIVGASSCGVCANETCSGSDSLPDGRSSSLSCGLGLGFPALLDEGASLEGSASEVFDELVKLLHSERRHAVRLANGSIDERAVGARLGVTVRPALRDGAAATSTVHRTSGPRAPRTKGRAMTKDNAFADVMSSAEWRVSDSPQPLDNANEKSGSRSVTFARPIAALSSGSPADAIYASAEPPKRRASERLSCPHQNQHFGPRALLPLFRTLAHLHRVSTILDSTLCLPSLIGLARIEQWRSPRR